MTTDKEQQLNDTIEEFILSVRSDLYERLLNLSKTSSSSDYAFDDKDSIIDLIDDLIEHSKLKGRQEARKEVIEEVDKTIERLYLANEEAFSNNALIRYKDKLRKYLIEKYNCSAYDDKLKEKKENE